MAKETKSKRFQGVYFRELENGDRSYFLRIRLDGKVKRIPIGKKSQGITEQFCNQEKNRILNAHRFGEDAALELQKVKRVDPTFEELFQEVFGKMTVLAGIAKRQNRDGHDLTRKKRVGIA